MIMPVGKTFVVLPHASGAISGASHMPLSVRIVIFIILFLFLIANSMIAFSAYKDLFYYRPIEADDIVACCITSALFIANLAICITIWFA